MLMQVTINSDNTVTMTVNRNEMAVIDYGLGYFAAQQPSALPLSDIELANALEQQLFTEYCKLVDQIQEQSQYGSLEQQEALWAHRQLTGE